MSVIGKFFCGICVAAMACSAENLFPIQQNSTWSFGFKSYTGHSAGGTTDTGVILWKIVKIPSMGDSRLLIEQTRLLTRRTFSMTGMEGGYDSLYYPPRERIDTVVFTSGGNTLYRNNGQVIVVDRAGSKPDSISVCDTALADVHGDVHPATYVISGVCDLSKDTSFRVSKHPTFNFYFFQDGVGPVAYVYDSHGTTDMVGGYSWEHWQRQSTIRVLGNPAVLSARSVTAFSKRVSIGSSLPTNGVQIIYGAQVMDIRGRLLPKIVTDVRKGLIR